jgi:hypothetical protein
MTTTKTTRLWALLLMAVLCAPFPAAAQSPAPEKKPLAAWLGWTGIATAAVGGALMIPWKTEVGAEDLELYGDDVCVVSTDRKFNVYDGQCDTTEPMIKAGLITMGVGAALALVGFHKVEVKPLLGHKVVGAKVAIQW